MSQPTPVSSSGDEMIFDSNGKPIPDRFPIELPQSTEPERDVLCYHVDILLFDGRELAAHSVKTILAEELKTPEDPIRVELDDLPSELLKRFAGWHRHARNRTSKNIDDDSARKFHSYWRITTLYGNRGTTRTSAGSSHILKIRMGWERRQRDLRAKTAS